MKWPAADYVAQQAKSTRSRQRQKPVNFGQFAVGQDKSPG